MGQTLQNALGQCCGSREEDKYEMSHSLSHRRAESGVPY